MTQFVYISEIIGTVVFFLLFALKFYLAIDRKTSPTTLRVAILWTSIYIFFLFVLRLFLLIHVGTLDALRIVSSYTVFIPFLAVLIQLWINKHT